MIAVPAREIGHHAEASGHSAAAFLVRPGVAKHATMIAAPAREIGHHAEASGRSAPEIAPNAKAFRARRVQASQAAVSHVHRSEARSHDAQARGRH
jgi:hypothetical protein